ncbi:hypothetical protein BDN67DRAFT_965424 [Paxillus ammoniavirescens]|nr:hypothetical protein BDN67DRAFT_965424 [Paxillus ammoniavirescens]
MAREWGTARRPEAAREKFHSLALVCCYAPIPIQGSNESFLFKILKETPRVVLRCYPRLPHAFRPMTDYFCLSRRLDVLNVGGAVRGFLS